MFSHASFRSADLTNAQLAGGTFDAADFRDADLERTALHGADLANARGLTQDQLDEACGDSRTRLPRGLSVRSCSGGVRMIVKPDYHRSMRMIPAVPAVPAPPPAPPAPPAAPRYLLTTLP